MINPHSVLSAIADWLEAKRQDDQMKPEPAEYGMFGFPASDDRDDGDEVTSSMEVQDKYLKAQAALEAYVDLRIHRAISKLIEQSEAAERDTRGHDLYPEREKT